MAGVKDIAQYILKQIGPMTAMKLQKLVYYSQAWSLVWDEKPLFPERIEAWANGPVCPALYEEHRGQYQVSIVSGDPSILTHDELETVDAVLRAYGERSAQWLSDLTHSESPWRDARKGIPDGARGDAEITYEAMADYYSSLTTENATSLG